MKKSMMIMVLSLMLVASCAHSPRPWTKEEKIAAGFFMLAHTANAFTTEKMLDAGHCEINPILGEYPSDGKITVYFSLTAISGLLIGHYWPDMRIPLFLGYGSINTYFVIHDSKLY